LRYYGWDNVIICCGCMLMFARGSLKKSSWIDYGWDNVIIYVVVHVFLGLTKNSSWIDYGWDNVIHVIYVVGACSCFLGAR
jgi:hypothetical protein